MDETARPRRNDAPETGPRQESRPPAAADVDPPPPARAERRVPTGRRRRRRDRIVAEIERNRRGEYTVPTWVLAVALVALVGGFLALILSV